MDEFNFKRSHVPAFGSWDCNGELPFTQCFESAREAGLLRCSYTEERDLYVAGDLYENDAFTPAMIVVPRHRGKNSRKKEGKKKNGSVVWDCGFDDLKAPPSPAGAAAPPCRPQPKAVDEDLYKISPDLLRAQSKRKRPWKLFSSCLPSCLY
ncbi:uncharacterized protein LOC130999459 [Salvia miltiorrhiza]|uniref:uncharacterized protein LOC130999459 n=1 Tax=Salvia miltiorrhiza TaxID=226208 RepID=UPI0025AC44A8|nr:uncharacterized protein LOC130999459 [Salvia miltiorrhiza]